MEFDAGAIVRRSRAPHYEVRFDPRSEGCGLNATSCGWRVLFRAASPQTKATLRKRAMTGPLELDQIKLMDLVADHCVMGWEGLTIAEARAHSLFPPDALDALEEALTAAGREEIPWTPKTARDFTRESQPFRDWLDQMYTDAAKLTEALEVTRGEDSAGMSATGTGTGA